MGRYVTLGGLTFQLGSKQQIPGKGETGVVHGEYSNLCKYAIDTSLVVGTSLHLDDNAISLYTYSLLSG